MARESVGWKSWLAGETVIPRRCRSSLATCRSSRRAGFGRVDAGKADQFLRESAHVVGHVLVGDLGAQISALEPQHDGLVHRRAFGPVVVGVGRGHRPPDRLGSPAIRVARRRIIRALAPRSNCPSCSGDCQMCV